MNIIDNIEKHHYVATDAQVEMLARDHYTANSAALRANGTYLRVLIAACQAELGQKRGRTPAVEAQLVVLERVHERFYAAVLRGTLTPDVEAAAALDSTERGRRQLERNRRSGFARSAATTLRNYIRAGGDLRGLDLSSVSKTSLQRAASPDTPVDDKRLERINRAEQVLLRAIKSQARGDPEIAAANLEAIIERLQIALDELLPDKSLAAPVAAATQTRHARTRVGQPFMRLPT